MNDVIDKLAEIEAAAGKIAENTNVQKVRIAKESEQKIKEYDKNFQRKLDDRIETMKAKNDREIQEEMKQMHQRSIRETEKLEEEYNARHEELAKEIVNMLTGV